MSLRVVAFSLPGSEASARTRLADLQPALAAAGVELELRPWPRGAARRRVGRSLGEHDVVVLQRVLVEEAPLVGLRRAARALVLDMDDAIDQRPWGRRASLRLRRRYRRTLAACDLVTVGSEHLLRRAARLHPRVRLLPPATSAPAQLAPRPAPPPLRLVWTGSRHTLPYLEDLGRLLAEISGEGPLELRVLADRAPRLPAPVPLDFVPWSLAAEEEALRWGHVGLYPLRDDAWSAGKCAYKVRRYMAFGLATLASPQGGGREALEPPSAGWVAESPAEWSAALRRLLAQPEEVAAMGQRARALSLARDTLELRGARLAGILGEAAAVGRRRATRG